MYDCYDDNFFATKFHIDLFTNTFWDDDRDIDRQLLHSIRQVGWPMEYIKTDLNEYKNMEKEDIILFPHRIAPEKQPEVFDYIAEQMPEYKFIKCQELDLTKPEYHSMLGKAKLVFSANLQETLGISVYEGIIVDAIPMVPDRLSYTEMWRNEFKYPSEWTTNLESTKKHIEEIKQYIRTRMNNYDEFESLINHGKRQVEAFYDASKLVNILKNY